MVDGVVEQRLAAHMVPWLRSWRAGLTSLDEVVVEMTGHGMAGVDQVVLTDSDDSGLDLIEGLAKLSMIPADEIRLVLAVPGDVRGLPIAGAFTAAALTQGQAVTAVEVGIVPEHHVHTSGSGDTWETVSWRMFTLPTPPVPTDTPTVGEADMALSEAVREATRVLVALDVAGWDPELGHALTQVRAPQGRQLPPGFNPRSRRLFDRASLLDRAVRLAEADALGGAVSAHEASERREALRPLAIACRQALTAACHARLA